MNFMDQTRDAAQGNGQAMPGQFGTTTRPKQRFIDKVMMKQRDRQGQAAQALSQMLGPTGMPDAVGFQGMPFQGMNR
jgi:hypothetical protein